MKEIKKIALLLPPFKHIYGKFSALYRRGFLNPPMSFAYIAASLEKHGHKVIIIDGEAENIDIVEILSRVQEFRPDAIGLTVTSPTFSLTLDFAKILKNTFTGVPFIIGGTHVSIFQKSVLEENNVFDFGVIGDGEITLCELMDRLDEKSSYKEIKGLIWRSDDTTFQNDFRPPEKNLDVYPFPARHLLRNDLYMRNNPYVGYQISAAFMATRGCPYNCIYCAVKNIPNGTMVRFRSTENIIEELDQIVNGMGIKHVAFNDDCLTFRRNNVMVLCEEIHKRGLKFTWEGLSRADRVDLEMLKEMKRAGFVRMSFGIESGNQRILDVLQKNESLEDIANGIRMAHQAGIVTRGSVIIGSPHETKSEVEETFRFITKLKELDQVVINIMQPYPGTKVREMVLKGEGGTRLMETDLSELRRFGNASMEVNDLTSTRLISLQRKGMRHFYFTPSKLIRNLVINHPSAILRDSMAALVGLFGGF